MVLCVCVCVYIKKKEERVTFTLPAWISHKEVQPQLCFLINHYLTNMKETIVCQPSQSITTHTHFKISSYDDKPLLYCSRNTTISIRNFSKRANSAYVQSAIPTQYVHMHNNDEGIKQADTKRCLLNVEGNPETYCPIADWPSLLKTGIIVTAGQLTLNQCARYIKQLITNNRMVAEAELMLRSTVLRTGKFTS